MIDIFIYHWVWYLIGFMCCPKITFMIWLSLYFGNALPLPLMIVGWILALSSSFKVEKEYYPGTNNLKSIVWRFR